MLWEKETLHRIQKGMGSPDNSWG